MSRGAVARECFDFRNIRVEGSFGNLLWVVHGKLERWWQTLLAPNHKNLHVVLVPTKLAKTDGRREWFLIKLIDFHFLMIFTLTCYFKFLNSVLTKNLEMNFNFFRIFYFLF
jgi:hypothetical protein